MLRRAGRGEQLTDDEHLQFQLRSNALLRYWEDVHYQYRLGLYDEVEYERQKAALEGNICPLGWIRALLV